MMIRDEPSEVGPVRASVVVRAPVERAFRAFTDGIAEWWPLRSHSLAGEDAIGAVFESGVGGRIYERMKDGREADWGRVTVWEPPNRVVYEWQPNPTRPAATEVEVHFIAENDGTTRVELEHRGWERLGDDAAEQRSSYAVDSGWTLVLARYAQHPPLAVAAPS